MNFWSVAKGVALVLAGLVIALAIQGDLGGRALTIYVFALGVALVALTLLWLRRALPLASESRRLLPQQDNPVDEVEQFRTLERRLSLASSSAYDLHFRLRPLIREIARARLARQHGVDLDREPEQARALVGNGRVWELIRPDREPPEDRHARGWSEYELESLMEELEGL